MAGGLKMSLVCSRFAVALAIPGGMAYAEDRGPLPDPTRPPVQIEAAPAATQSSTDPKAPSAGLQTIVLRKGGKSIAVINGEAVRIGGKIGDATLVELTETHAVLKGPAGKQLLFLTPGVERVSSSPAKPDASTEKSNKSLKKHASTPLEQGR